MFQHLCSENLGAVRFNDLASAREFLLEAERVSESLPFKGLEMPRAGLGRLALLEGDIEQAAALAAEAAPQDSPSVVRLEAQIVRGAREQSDGRRR